MSKHTPGPWTLPHFADDSVDCNCLYILADGYAGAICVVNVDNGLPISEGGNDCPPLEEAIANAYLLHAAPDLLDACRCHYDDGMDGNILREASESLRCLGGPYERMAAKLEEKANAEDAAIAKAEGKDGGE